MPPRVQKEYLIQVRDEDHLASFMNANPAKLLIIDVYLDWCGPCFLLGPTYKSIAMKIDEWDQRIQFLQADISRGTKLMTEISGVNVPAISAAVNRVAARWASVKSIVNNLSDTVTTYELSCFITQWVKPVNVYVPKDESNRNKGIGLVWFTSETDFEKVATMLENRELMGRKLSMTRPRENLQYLGEAFMEGHREDI